MEAMQTFFFVHIQEMQDVGSFSFLGQPHNPSSIRDPISCEVQNHRSTCFERVNDQGRHDRAASG